MPQTFKIFVLRLRMFKFNFLYQKYYFTHDLILGKILNIDDLKNVISITNNPLVVIYKRHLQNPEIKNMLNAQEENRFTIYYRIAENIYKLIFD